jgi:hypothetical protein
VVVEVVERINVVVGGVGVVVAAGQLVVVAAAVDTGAVQVVELMVVLLTPVVAEFPLHVESAAVVSSGSSSSQYSSPTVAIVASM